MPPAAYDNGRQDDGECASDCPGASIGVDARDEHHAGETDREPDDLRSAQRVVRQEAQAEDGDEDRYRRLGDPGDARVDVRLAPRDERHRDRGVHDAENEARDPRAAERSDRRADSGSLHEICRQQQQPAIDEPEVGHRRGRNVLDGDLDEEVRGAPHRRQEQDQRPVRAHRSRLPRRARPAAFARFDALD